MLPIDPARFALFCGVMAAFAIAPGPANLFLIATGARAGPRGVLLGVAGINTASIVWIAAAAFGLGALAAAYPLALRAIAVAGGLYVGWLGLKALFAVARDGDGEKDSVRGAAPGAAFRDGFAVQISNPKAVIFFSAILPPFIDPARAALPQFAIMGAVVLLMDVAAMTSYGMAGGALAATLQRRGPRRWFSLFVGVLLCAASLFILFRH